MRLSRNESGQIHLLDVLPCLAQKALGISEKLQWDECWLRGLTQQILESILLFRGHSGNLLPENVKCFSIGKRRQRSSAGKKRLWNPFTALRVTVHVLKSQFPWSWHPQSLKSIADCSHWISNIQRYWQGGCIFHQLAPFSKRLITFAVPQGSYMRELLCSFVSSSGDKRCFYSLSIICSFLSVHCLSSWSWLRYYLIPAFLSS